MSHLLKILHVDDLEVFIVFQARETLSHPDDEWFVHVLNVREHVKDLFSLLKRTRLRDPDHVVSLQFSDRHLNDLFRVHTPTTSIIPARIEILTKNLTGFENINR